MDERVDSVRRKWKLISLVSKCGHHRADLKGLVMRVIAGDPELEPTTALTCHYCSKISFWIDEPLIKESNVVSIWKRHEG